MSILPSAWMLMADQTRPPISTKAGKNMIRDFAKQASFMLTSTFRIPKYTYFYIVCD